MISKIAVGVRLMIYLPSVQLQAKINWV